MKKNNTIISFKDFIAISEGKQVGVLYHFTRLSSLISMFPDFEMMSHQEYISFTRNYNMMDYENFKNDFSIDQEKYGINRRVRIAIDGDKLSNKFKIEPYLDKPNQISRSSGEYEERIKKDKVSIKCCILQIDIIDPDKKIADSNDQDMQKIMKKYKVNFISQIKKLKKVR